MMEFLPEIALGAYLVTKAAVRLHPGKKWQVRKVLLNWRSGGKSLAKDKKMISLEILTVLLQIDL